VQQAVVEDVEEVADFVQAGAVLANVVQRVAGVLKDHLTHTLRLELDAYEAIHVPADLVVFPLERHPEVEQVEQLLSQGFAPIVVEALEHVHPGLHQQHHRLRAQPSLETAVEPVCIQNALEQDRERRDYEVLQLELLDAYHRLHALVNVVSFERNVEVQNKFLVHVVRKAELGIQVYVQLQDRDQRGFNEFGLLDLRQPGDCGHDCAKGLDGLPSLVDPRFK